MLIVYTIINILLFIMDLNDSKTRIQLPLERQKDDTYTSLAEAAKAFEMECST